MSRGHIKTYESGNFKPNQWITSKLTWTNVCPARHSLLGVSNAIKSKISDRCRVITSSCAGLRSFTGAATGRELRPLTVASISIYFKKSLIIPMDRHPCRQWQEAEIRGTFDPS